MTEKVTKIIIEAIEKLDLNIETKVELMINMKHFLKDYDKNIKILRKEMR